MNIDMNGINIDVVNMLIERNLHISSAESCTGGLFSALITDVPGSSEIFDESIVTYSNEAKMIELGVKEETLRRFGAVSRQTAKEMAEGICAHTNADIGVAITGIFFRFVRFFNFGLYFAGVLRDNVQAQTFDIRLFDLGFPFRIVVLFVIRQKRFVFQ